MSEAWIHFADYLEFAAKKADAETIRGYLKQIATQQSFRERLGRMTGKREEKL